MQRLERSGPKSRRSKSNKDTTLAEQGSRVAVVGMESMTRRRGADVEDHQWGQGRT